MKKNKFLTSTLILMCGGFITKILGFIIKVVYTRIVGNVGVSLYSIVMPTYSLLITIASLSLPIAISKLIAEHKNSSKKILISSTFIILLVNVALITITLSSARFIATTLLQNDETYYLIIAMSATLPFISISSVIKGYFFGKQEMLPSTISNIFEQIARLLLIYLVLPKLMATSVLLAVIFLILLNVISEIISIIVLLFFLPRNIKLKKRDLKPDKRCIKDVLDISIPTVSSRFIGNIGLFFEPIVLTFFLVKMGYSNEYILMEYGVYNGYTISLLILPSFFVSSICSALIPEISKYAGQNNKSMIKRRFFQATGFSFIIGFLFSMLIFFFREQLLSIVYNTTLGVDYIKVLAPFFVLFYLEAPIISTLQALGKSKATMQVTFYGQIIKLVTIVLLSNLKIGIYSLIYAEIINIIFVVLANLKHIIPILRNKEKNSY